MLVSRLYVVGSHQEWVKLRLQLHVSEQNLDLAIRKRWVVSFARFFYMHFFNFIKQFEHDWTFLNFIHFYQHF